MFDTIDNNKKNIIFNVIMGISTLLITIIGSTFAYFSTSTLGSNNIVKLRSAYLGISYDSGTKISADNLIPSSLNVMLEEYKSKTGPRCVDASGRQVCYVYEFTVSSDLEDNGTTDIIGTIKINDNEFENLSYILYRVDFDKNSNGQVIYIDDGLGNGGQIEKVKNYEFIASNFKYKDNNLDVGSYASYTFNKFSNPIIDNNGKTIKPVDCLFGYVDDYENYSIDDSARCSKHTIKNGGEYVYQLVIWLEETGTEQKEQGLEFNGEISIDVSDGSHITGTLNKN